MASNTKNIPKLRFKEFSGEWDEHLLDNIADVKGGKRIPKGYTLQKEQNSHPYITVSDMENMTIRLNRIQYVPDEVFPLIKNYTITSDDIYISVAGTLGLVGIIPEVLNGANLTENADKLENIKCNQFFLLYYLSTPKFNKLIESSKTDNAQPKLAIYIIKSFQVLLPSKLEQQKIADFLSTVDKKIQQLKQKQQLLQQYKKGMMQKLFSQQIRFKDENGLDYPEWEVSLFGDIATFYKGKGISKADIVINGIIPCIRYGELYTHYNEVIGDLIYSFTNVPIDSLILSKKDDVIIPASGETKEDIAKASCILHEGIALGGDLNIIRSNLNGSFLAYYLSYYKNKDIANLAQGISVIHLYANQLKTLLIDQPSLPEQQKIADFLCAIDKKIDAVNKQISQMAQFKQGLLQQLFI